MNRNLAIAAFAGLLAVQALPPVSLAVQRTQALHQGRPVLLSVETRDPRDIFRGEYSVLAYGIGNLQAVALDPASADSCPTGHTANRAPDCRLTPGSQVFVILEGDPTGVHRAVRASHQRPEAGTTYATGKMQGFATIARGEQACGTGACLTGRVAYGIENWYGPQGRPATLDQVPRGDVRVEARLDPDGTLLLDGIQVKGETFARTNRLW